MSKSLMVLLNERHEIAESLANAENPVELVEQIDKAVQVKVAGIALYLDMCGDAIEQLDYKIKQLQERRKMFQGRIDSLKEYTYQAMKMNGIPKIDCPEVSISIVKNPPKAEIFEEKLIPIEYWKRPPWVLDKKSLLDDLKEGVVVDGARLSQSESVRIR